VVDMGFSWSGSRSIDRRISSTPDPAATAHRVGRTRGRRWPRASGGPARVPPHPRRCGQPPPWRSLT